MTPAQIQALIDACRTGPSDLVMWAELKAVLEGLKNQDGVTSFNGRDGIVVGEEGDYNLTDMGDVVISVPTTNQILRYDGSDWVNDDETVYVPYTGATANVTLGEYGIKTGWYGFDLTPTGTPADQGTMYWEDSFKTAAIIMNGVTQEIGHDQFYHAKNSSGTTIPKGTAVGFAGTDGGSGHLLITPFIANGTTPSTSFMGVTAEAITNGSFGKVQSFGRLDGINTTAFNEGDILYVSTTTAGAFQTTVPVAPNNIIQVAAVVSDANNGKLLIRPILGSKLTSDESVVISSPTNGQVLQYNSTTGVWQNATISTTNIYTADGTLTANRTVTSGGFSLTFTGAVNLASAGGNVGIGTTSPTTRLQVNGTISTNAYSTAPTSGFGLYMGHDGTEAGIFSYNYTTAAWLAISYSGLQHRWSTSGSERMRIFSNGNIAINSTVDAGFKLDVNGTARVQAAFSVVNQSTILGTGRILSELYYNAKGQSTTPGTRFISYGIGRPDGGFGNVILAGMGGFFSGAAWPNGIGLSFFTAEAADISGGASTTEKMTITAGGNVGIGTTSPTYQLDLVSGGNTIGGVRTTYALGAASASWTVVGKTSASADIQGIFQAVGGEETSVRVRSVTNHPLTFWVSTVERMRLFTNGNFAIGTTTDAGFRLDVNGTARVQGQLTVSSTAIGGITGTQLNNNRPLLFVNDGTSGGWNGGYMFRGGGNTSAGVNIMTVFSAGTTDAQNGVGIGSDITNAWLQNATSVRLAVASRLAVANAVNFEDIGSFFVNNNGYTYSTGRVAGITLGEANNAVPTSGSNVNYSVHIGYQRDPLVNGYGSSMVFSAKDDSGATNQIMRIAGRTQSVGIGTVRNDASAVFEIVSTTRGFLMPRMTTTQRNAITSPATGLEVYNTTDNVPQWYNGTAWTNFLTNNVYTADGTIGGDRTITMDGGNFHITAGSVGIGTTSVDGCAILELDSTTKGLLLSRMTTTERNSISNPVAGLLIYNTTTNKVNLYDGSNFVEL